MIELEKIKHLLCLFAIKSARIISNESFHLFEEVLIIQLAVVDRDCLEKSKGLICAYFVQVLARESHELEVFDEELVDGRLRDLDRVEIVGELADILAIKLSLV